jgi:hypothetical protein
MPGHTLIRLHRPPLALRLFRLYKSMEAHGDGDLQIGPQVAQCSLAHMILLSRNSPPGHDSLTPRGVAHGTTPLEVARLSVDSRFVVLGLTSSSIAAIISYTMAMAADARKCRYMLLLGCHHCRAGTVTFLLYADSNSDFVELSEIDDVAYTYEHYSKPSESVVSQTSTVQKVALASLLDVEDHFDSFRTSDCFDYIARCSKAAAATGKCVFDWALSSRRSRSMLPANTASGVYRAAVVFDYSVRTECGLLRLHVDDVSSMSVPVNGEGRVAV